MYVILHWKYKKINFDRVASSSLSVQQKKSSVNIKVPTIFLLDVFASFILLTIYDNHYFFPNVRSMILSRTDHFFKFMLIESILH